MSRTRHFLFAFVFVLLAMAAKAAPPEENTNPKVSVVIAEGFAIAFDDEGNSSPGAVTTRVMVVVGLKLPDHFGLSVAGGLCTPNDTFRPDPRIAFSTTYTINEVSLGVSGLYQYNPKYTASDDKVLQPESHILVVGVGATYRFAPWFSAGIDIGPGWTLDKPGWGLTIQPKATLTF